MEMDKQRSDTSGETETGKGAGWKRRRNKWENHKGEVQSRYTHVEDTSVEICTHIEKVVKKVYFYLHRSERTSMRAMLVLFDASYQQNNVQRPSTQRRHVRRLNTEYLLENHTSHFRLQFRLKCFVSTPCCQFTRSNHLKLECSCPVGRKEKSK